MAITSGSYVRSTGSADSVGRTNVEGRTTAQLVADIAAPLASAGYMLKSENLSGLSSVAAARTNLGLGTAALLGTGDIQPSSANLTTLSGIALGATGLLLLEDTTPGEATDTIATGIAALTPALNVATNATGERTFSLTIDQNSTLDNPTGLIAGETYKWIITQDATGGRTLAYGAMFKWPGGVAPTLSAGIGDVDVITAIFNGTNLLATAAQDFS